MNVVLWILQGLLAAHTIAGAVWKVGNSEQAVPSLSSIPHGAWLALAGLEVICAVGLVLPALNRSLAVLVPIAALVIAAEMLFFSAVHLATSGAEHGQMVYWLVVAALCGFIAYGRFVLQPL